MLILYRRATVRPHIDAQPFVARHRVAVVPPRDVVAVTNVRAAPQCNAIARHVGAVARRDVAAQQAGGQTIAVAVVDQRVVAAVR